MVKTTQHLYMCTCSLLALLSQRKLLVLSERVGIRVTMFFQPGAKPLSAEKCLERHRTLQRQRTSDHCDRESTEQREECLSRRCSLEQQCVRDQHAAEAVEEREECLSRHRGVSRQCERDQRAIETEAQRERRLAH